jgi:hypothetical protein
MPTERRVMTAAERADFRNKFIAKAANGPYEDKKVIWCISVITRQDEAKIFFIQTENAEEAREFNLQWAYALLAEKGKKQFSYKNLNLDVADFRAADQYMTDLLEIPAGYKER